MIFIAFDGGLRSYEVNWGQTPHHNPCSNIISVKGDLQEENMLNLYQGITKPVAFWLLLNLVPSDQSFHNIEAFNCRVLEPTCGVQIYSMKGEVKLFHCESSLLNGFIAVHWHVERKIHRQGQFHGAL